jgi:hypothetical protein
MNAPIVQNASIGADRASCGKSGYECNVGTMDIQLRWNLCRQLRNKFCHIDVADDQLMLWCTTKALPIGAMPEAASGHGSIDCKAQAALGMSTVSITWMTPLVQAISAVTTLAPLIVTPDMPST